MSVCGDCQGHMLIVITSHQAVIIRTHFPGYAYIVALAPDGAAPEKGAKHLPLGLLPLWNLSLPRFCLPISRSFAEEKGRRFPNLMF